MLVCLMVCCILIFKVESRHDVTVSQQSQLICSYCTQLGSGWCDEKIMMVELFLKLSNNKAEVWLYNVFAF